MAIQIGVIKKAKGEYWGVLHNGDIRYHFWAQCRGTFKQAWRAAQAELQKRYGKEEGKHATDNA